MWTTSWEEFITRCARRRSLVAVNLVAPNAVRNAEFTKVLASVLRRPAVLPAPEFALRLVFGKQAAEEMLLASQRVQPGKLGASGYEFRFRELRAALENLVG